VGAAAAAADAAGAGPGLDALAEEVEAGAGALRALWRWACYQARAPPARRAGRGGRQRAAPASPAATAGRAPGRAAVERAACAPGWRHGSLTGWTPAQPGRPAWLVLPSGYAGEAHRATAPAQPACSAGAGRPGQVTATSSERSPVLTLRLGAVRRRRSASPRRRARRAARAPCRRRPPCTRPWPATCSACCPSARTGRRLSGRLPGAPSGPQPAPVRPDAGALRRRAKQRCELGWADEPRAGC